MSIKPIRKKSNYNVIIETLQDGSDLIYNTYSGIFGIMDTKTQAIFNDIENFDADCGDEEALSAVNIMAKAGYIVDIDKDELAAIKIERARRRYNNTNLHITIAPTLDCNMACPYCFENKSKLVMSNETQEQLFTFVKVHLDAYTTIKSLSVTWYGGEPLMQKDIIYNLSEKLIKLCEEKEVRYSANIITNGILLDADTARRLSDDCKVNRAQITIDGLKETHNKRRVFLDSGDSFDIVTQNIDACKDYLAISVRVNIDKDNAEEAEELTRYFLEEKGWTGKPSFHLAPVSEYEESCLNENSRCLQGEQFAEVDIKSTRALYAVNRDAVAGYFFPSRRAIFCGGEGPLSYVVDPEGRIYNCYVWIGNVERSTGHISKPFVVSSEYGKWLLGDIHNKCEQCQFLPMCMGGCMIHRLTGDGEPRCFRTFYTYKDTLKLACEDYVAQQLKQVSFSEVL